MKNCLQVLFVLLPLLTMGKVIENDWINYDQKYYKFPVYKDGIYRLTYVDLIGAGINLQGVDPEDLQIFGRGKEVYSYVRGEKDGSFDPNDYIEFFAEKNDGWYDYKLFSDSSHLGNPYYSMFTDTINYYLTWNGSKKNNRIELEPLSNFSGHSVSPYFWNTVHVVQNAAYNRGQLTVHNWATPEYSSGEGWGSQSFSHGSYKTISVPTPNPFAFGPDPILSVGVAGQKPNAHAIQVSVEGTEINSSTYYNFEMLHLTKSFTKAWLKDQTEVKVSSLIFTGNKKEYNALMYLSVKYPSNYDLEDKQELKLTIPSINGAGTKDHLKITKFKNENSPVWLYDLTHHKKVEVDAKGGDFNILLPDNGQDRECWLTSEAAINFVKAKEIVPVSLVNASSSFIDYKSLSDAKGGVDYFIIAPDRLLAEAEEYATYRSSTGHKAMAISAEQLYDQYSYGIRRHPMAIRNFVLKAYEEWGEKPKNILLFGKSVASQELRKSTLNSLNSLPTWGSLGADIGFTNGVEGLATLEPLIPIGRIAVRNATQARAYLNKVKSYESAEAAPWMKNVLHFGGGSNVGEQTTFKRNLKEYEDIIKAPNFGGNVHTFLKSSSDPLQINLSDSVTNLINSGVSLMCFFGHAYGSNFDQSIDEPENYNNSGRYGFIIANSCLIGNIHTTSVSSGSERFVLAENKGTIGFLGSSSLGVPSFLHNYSKEFYKNVALNKYGKTVGEIVQQTIKTIQDSSKELSRDLCMHMTLHGDPALVLNAHALPDYTLYPDNSVSVPQIYFSPTEVTTEVDSFAINIIVTNIGKAQSGNVQLLIKRGLPSGKDTSYTRVIEDLFFKDTITVMLPVDPLRGIGINSFDVIVDFLGRVDELSELNNSANVKMIIRSGEIRPVYPYEFAVVPDQYPVLKASTSNPYAGSMSYVFQIDTNEAFSSPKFFEEKIVSTGGVVKWDPSSSSGLKSFFSSFPSSPTIENPTVYFWRVRPVLDSGKEIWKGSSFQHVSGKSGWGQAHFQQYKKNIFQFMDYNYDELNYEFVEQTKEINCINTYWNLATDSNRFPLVKVDGIIKLQFSTVWRDRPNISVAVVDKKTLELWRYDEHGDYGHLQTLSYIKKNEDWNELSFQFGSNNQTAMDSLISLVNDVPDSNYILMFDWAGHYLSSFYAGTNPVNVKLKSLMQSMGADVDAMMNYSSSAPYIFFTQKGDSSKAKESFLTGEPPIQLSAQMKNNWKDGTMTSTMIGPSTKWNSFHWKVDDGELLNNLDSSQIMLFGVGVDNTETLLIDTLASQGDVLDLSFIDAALYPNLQLKLYLKDDSLTTPRKLGRWQVLFDEIPEAALNPLKLHGFSLVDSLQQGDDFVFETAIENISSTDMDSIQVVYWLLDDNFNLQKSTYKQHGKLPSGAVLYDTLSISTLNLKGNSGLWYEVNPYTGVKPWQLEQHHFNNVNLAQFSVDKDLINPLLDVTFDGIHILDGDIVSPTPYIVVTLDDENQYLALDDPSLIQVFIEYPSVDKDSLVLLDPSEYTFKEGSMPKNQATIEYQGSFPTDGVYKLKIMSRDRSNNISGKGDGLYDFSISFEVVNKSSITEVMNWPNPFSTSTQFVFTLTGSVLPDEFRIQILTITGKIVREIEKEEFGAINIGRNISDFKWDGKDQYGDQLANGVYLYRVIVNKENHEFEERSISIDDNDGSSTIKDKYFKKGFGKMYLLR